MLTEQHAQRLPASIPAHRLLNISNKHTSVHVCGSGCVGMIAAHMQQLLSVIRPQPTEDVIQDKPHSCIARITYILGIMGVGIC